MWNPVVKAKVQYFEGTDGNDKLYGFNDIYSNPDEVQAILTQYWVPQSA